MTKNIIISILIMFVTTWVSAQIKQKSKEQNMDRIELSQKKYTELFGDSSTAKPELDPELMDIIKKFTFGEIFYAGNLNDSIRELITIVSLTTQQSLPQLKVHINAALRIGISPIAIKESVYQVHPLSDFQKC